MNALLGVALLGSEGAEATAGSSIELFSLITGLIGGLALFLYGMEKLATALKAVAGEGMKGVLAKLTSNRFTGVLTGAFVTTIIQSSSVTTVLVVGFITAGLMSMTQSIGVIMGANIGTTITAQIVAFKVTKLALLMVGLGFGLEFLSKNDRLKKYGSGLLGLGLIFFGMNIMGEAMRPLRSFQPFIDWMARMENPALGILAGAFFTALVQSSSATTAIVIVMAKTGLIELPAGIALCFGANIGTCVTAMLAAIGKPREAQRAAAVHVLFNVIGVLIWVLFIGKLSEFVAWISPAADSSLDDTSRLAMETPRQIANAHTIFNVANTAILIWFAPLFARLVNRIVPDRPLQKEDLVRTKYLDEELLTTPSLALDRARLEILHMSDTVREMLVATPEALFSGTDRSLTELARKDDKVDILHGETVTYLGKISKQQLTAEQTEVLVKLMSAANDLENIGDLIETNMVANARQRLDRNVTVSQKTRGLMKAFHEKVMRAYDAAILAVTQKNEEAARLAIGMKEEMNRLSDAAVRHEAQRLVASEPNRLAAYTIEIDTLENLKRVYSFCKRMARSVVTPSVKPD